MRSGQRVQYRVNRGDIQSIREVLLDEAYRLPFPMWPRVIVDLGANIGLTSLWLAMHYAPDVVLAVEPDPDNARLARRNLEPLGATVVEAAVGPVDGRAHFRRARASNLGAVVLAAEADAASVDMLSIPTLLDRHGVDTVDLMKLDIEGGEQALLDGDVTWLSRVRSLIVEFHPTIVDYERLVKRVESQGLRYIPAGSAWPGSMHAFVRPSSTLESP